MHSASTLSTSDPTRNLPPRGGGAPRGGGDNDRHARLVEDTYDSDSPPAETPHW